MLKCLKILYFSVFWRSLRLLTFGIVLVSSQDLMLTQKLARQWRGLENIHPAILGLHGLLLLTAIAGCYDLLQMFRNTTQQSQEHTTARARESAAVHPNLGTEG
jgi:hypothetical protein